MVKLVCIMKIKDIIFIVVPFLLLLSAISTSTSAQDAQRKLNNKNNRPYDAQLVRLSELLGAIHYLRELCGANEGQVWRQQMTDLIEAEGTTPFRRVKLVNSFNKGYRGYRRTYRSCTSSAKLAVSRSIKEGASLASAIVEANK